MKPININTIREQISRRIKNYQTTMEGIGQGNPNTDWHQKQIKVLESKISELEWMLNIIPEPKPFCLAATVDDGIVEKFLDNGVFRKDSNGLYCYTSDDGNHITNLSALLDDFKTNLIAVGEANNYKNKNKNV